MKITLNNRRSNVTKIFFALVLILLSTENVSGIWDFSRPTNNPLQAAVGGIALGAAGGLALSYFKRRRGRRDAEVGVRIKICIGKIKMIC